MSLTSLRDDHSASAVINFLDGFQQKISLFHQKNDY
jgi:hypothetical protein